MVASTDSTSQQVGSRRFGVRKALGLGLLAVSTTVAGCAAVSQADTVSPQLHRSNGSLISAVAGRTTSDLTAAFPSSTTAQVVDSRVPALADQNTLGNLATLGDTAAWTIDIKDSLDGLRLAPMHGEEVSVPIQIGSVVITALRSSVLNSAGTAAFDMGSGRLLWQDRSLECQRVDLGGALPCRQNNGQWAPFNPVQGTFGEPINPGFAPEAFAFADGVLYTARTNGAGAIEVAAGSIAKPNEKFTVAVPRDEAAMLPGTNASITVEDDVKVRLGAAEIELTKDGQPLAPEATLASEPQSELNDLPVPANRVVPVRKQIGEVTIVNGSGDRLVALRNGTVLWSIPARLVDSRIVTDGCHVAVVSGTDSGAEILTVALADGQVVGKRAVVANGSKPKAIEAATAGVFHVDRAFSTISYYPAR